MPLINEGKRRVYQHRWYEANKARCLERSCEWRKKNREKAAESSRSWARAHPEIIRKRRRKFLKLNPGYQKAYNKIYTIERGMPIRFLKRHGLYGDFPQSIIEAVRAKQNAWRRLREYKRI